MTFKFDEFNGGCISNGGKSTEEVVTLTQMSIGDLSRHHRIIDQEDEAIRLVNVITCVGFVTALCSVRFGRS